MRLLIDTDAFCKLGVAGVLDEALELLGAGQADCGRLAALPYMLKRGRLRTLFGNDACDQILPMATSLPVAVQPGTAWLDRLSPIPEIDPGEAQLFAAAAESGLVIVSGDKRALRALKNVPGFSEALTGRIVVLEAILLALCTHLGAEQVRERVAGIMAADTMVGICFSLGNANPSAGLLSYFENLASELAPLVLWDPRGGGTP